MKILTLILRGGKLSYYEVNKTIDTSFLIVSSMLIIGYVLSYISFAMIRHIKHPEIREIVRDFGNLGLGILIVGHIAFAIIYSIVNRMFSIAKPSDEYIHLFFIALMVFYVYYCNKEQSKLTK